MGITSNNISGIFLAEKLHLRDGDILQAVNNEPIDSVGRIIEVVDKYSNATMFRIRIIRDGRQMSMTYRLK